MNLIKKLIGGLALIGLLAAGGHTGTAAPAMDKVALTYLYANSYQTGLTETSVAALMDPEAPAVATGDFHSLGELAAGDTSFGNIVEVGWTVDTTGVNGTDHTNPHLFVGAWVNGVFKGYNTAAGSGWVDYAATTFNAGDLLATGTVKNFGINYSGGNWWIQYDSQYIGYYPGSLWSSAVPPVSFTSFTRFQGFGEVAANSSAPCTDMGKGFLATGGTSPTGAKISTVTYSSGTTPVLTASATNSSYYNAVILPSGRTLYFGGPGAC